MRLMSVSKGAIQVVYILLSVWLSIVLIETIFYALKSLKQNVLSVAPHKKATSYQVIKGR